MNTFKPSRLRLTPPRRLLVIMLCCIVLVFCYQLTRALQATPEQYKQFTRLDEQLTANEIVAFRLKAIADLEELEEQEAVLSSSATVATSATAGSSLAVAAGEHDTPRQTWGQWLLRREPVPITAPAAGGDGDGDGDSPAGHEGHQKPAAAVGIGAATQREDAAAQAEFLRAFSSPGGDADGEKDGADELKHR